MNNLRDDEAHLLTFPVWFPIHPDTVGVCVVRTELADGAIGTPLFTDKHLAESFIASIPGMEIPYILGMANEPGEILPVINFCRKRGVTHFVIDPSVRTAGLPRTDEVRARHFLTKQWM